MVLPCTLPHLVLDEVAASILELKANPMKVVTSGNGMPVMVLNRNERAFYCAPVNAYEALVEMIDDIEIIEIVKGRQKKRSVKVSLDDL